MAIGFARMEFVQRSQGQNACHKAAYNARMAIRFQGTKFREAETFSYRWKDPVVYHAILLPEHADSKFGRERYLWNTVERAENRKDSQVQLDMVIALPDDQQLSVEQRVELVKGFVDHHFVSKGFGVQLNIHPPDRKVVTIDGKEQAIDHNWHAHVLVTTRRFTKDGKSFEATKPREGFMPTVRNGRVIDGDKWGALWAVHQNQFFNEKGIELQVDANGIEPQKHLGPVRMRGRAIGLLQEHAIQTDLNLLECRNPRRVLDKLTETTNIFTPSDVERFIHKWVDPKHHEVLKQKFWGLHNLVQLRDPDTKEPTEKYTTNQIILEERQAVRLAKRIKRRGAYSHREDSSIKRDLNAEQKQAFDAIVSGRQLSFIEGHAGAGKSHLLQALRDSYEAEGHLVRAFGPDSATANDLKDKQFKHASNVHRFLYDEHYDKLKISRKEVWVVDEAGKLGTPPLLQLLKLAEKHKAQLIIAGCSSQIGSVQRGNLFEYLSKELGAEQLIEIQRQKDIRQRRLVKKLAVGEVGAAIDGFSRIGSFQWSGSKEEATGNLITRWSHDRILYPEDSYVIISGNNREVKALNEMVRQIRRENGELGDEVYSCQTQFGTIYISTGDRIEFRRNENDLGVTNGLCGTLVKAKPNEFVVRIKEGRTSREVKFNPRKYQSFQLGYATTNYRSQGKTIDRTYVLHSPMFNKPNFYVSLSRHEKQTYFFISSDQAKNLSDLKRQMAREPERETTLTYTTDADLAVERRSAEWDTRIENLKTKKSLLSKGTGYGLGMVRGFNASIGKLAQDWSDVWPDQAFFRVSDTQSTRKGDAIEVGIQPAIIPSPLEQDAKPLVELAQQTISQAQPPPLPTPQSPNQERTMNWKKLSKERSAQLKTYFNICEQASALSEISGDGTANEAELKKLYIERNAQAHQIRKAFSDKELKGLLSHKGHEILQDRASRYQQMVDRRNEHKIDIQAELTERIEPLLYRLFPDGPTIRQGNSFRFGTKGSLSVTASGTNAGLFKDFERDEGGGMLKLIQRELGLDYQAARRWALDFIGQPTFEPVPRPFKRVKVVEREWVAMRPPSGAQAPSLAEISPKMAKWHNETARYTYRDKTGELLHYTVRCVNKNKPSDKKVLPLSYGYYKDGDQSPSWHLKGYASTQRSIYGLEWLAKHPNAKVLIVEGEKAADAAVRVFPDENLIVVSWLGGSGAVKQTDWTPLADREVIIWPDNDEPGLKAAGQISSKLRQIGVTSLKVVDSKKLEGKFPEKWDLADELPPNVSQRTLISMLRVAPERAIPVERCVRLGDGRLNHADRIVERAFRHEILWRVEERLRPSLEAEGRSPREINHTVLAKAESIFKQRDKLLDLAANAEAGSEIFARRVINQQVLYQAEHGQEPSEERVASMRATLRDQSADLELDVSKLEVHGISREKGLEYAHTLSDHSLLAGKPVLANHTAQVALNRFTAQADINQSLERSKGLELDISD